MKFGLHEMVGVAALGRKGIEILVTRTRRDPDLRAITRQRLRHVFVGEAHLRALGIKLEDLFW